MKPRSLWRSMLSFSGGTFASRLLGLVREIAIANAFGANAATDAFWVAFRVPNFLRRLFAEGSFSVAFVPVLTEVKIKQNHEQLRLLIASTAGTLGGLLLVITALGVIFAPALTGVFAFGSLDEAAKFELNIDLLRITFPFILFISLTALSGSVLNSFGKFGLSALTPIIMNLCMIAAAWWWSKYFAVPITALAWAVLISGVLQLAIQLPALAKLGLLSWPRWGWNHPDVRRIMRLMVPALFGSSVAQVNLLLDTAIASLLITGSQTWLSQSDRLLEFPLGVFGVALGTVILPSLSRHHVNTDRAGFSKALDWGLRTTLLIAMPAMIALVILARPLVSTLLQHGQYTAYDAQMAALVLSALSFGLPAFALVKVLAPAFYSRQDTKTPVRAGIVSMVANMGFNAIFLALLFALWHKPEDLSEGWLQALSKVPGLHMALGLASALASYLNLWMLWRALHRDDVYQREPGWARHWLRLGIACAALAAVLLAGLWLWPDWNVPMLMRIWRLTALVIGGGLVYFAALFALGFRVKDLRGV